MPIDPSAVRRLRRLLPTRSRELRRILETVARILDHDVNVMIVGESGSGKNYLAEAIHHCSPRRAHPFVAIDCSTLPGEIFESELFGYERGAFTDAQARKAGKIELSQGGTLYLDEVANLERSVQGKLLRVVQEKQFSRLGGNRTIELNARIISSAGPRLPKALREGSFREDLFYRLNVISVVLPPLRERKEDIPLLARSFLRKAVPGVGTPGDFHPRAMRTLVEYDWPGNVRQLRNVVENAAMRSGGDQVTVDALPLDAFVTSDSLLRSADTQAWTLDELEERYISEVLRRTRNNFSRAAEILGINRKTLLEKRKKYGLDSKEDSRTG